MMRKTIMGLALMSACAFSCAISTESAQARWYVSHSGEETCVPLDDIDTTDFSRLYYGSGTMHEPADFVSFTKKLGFRVEKIDTSVPGTFLYQARTGDAHHTLFALFNDEDFCKTMMATVQK